MFNGRFSLWLRGLLAPARTIRRVRSARLLLEFLEDRTLPSVTLLVQARPDLAATTAATWLNGQLPTGATLTDTAIPGLFAIETTPAQISGLADVIRANPQFAYAEQSVAMHALLEPNDPDYTAGTLYGMNGTFGIKAPQSWDVSTGSTTVIVGDIDTGIDYTHPDLYKNIWINQAEIPPGVVTAIHSDPTWDIDGDGLITFWDLNDPRNQGTGKITDRDGDLRITGADILKTTAQGGWADSFDADQDTRLDDLIGWDFVNGDNNPMDDNGHGTHTAGTIGGIGNNATGVVGVNWKVQIMPLKFLSASGNGNDLNSALALRFAVDHGSRVSNNSYASSGFSTTFLNAVIYANSRNHLVVAAAGNSSQNTDVSPNYPSNFDVANVISVAATDSTGALAGFSNYGPTTVDLGAPGADIKSTLPGGGYGFLSGTSMATPHVAGAAALILAHSPGLTTAALKDRILANVTPLASLAGRTVTGGLLNLFEAIRDKPEIAVLDGAANLTDGSSTVSFGSTFAGTPVSKTFTVQNLGNLTLTLNTPINVPAGYTVTSSFGTTSVAPGGSTTFTVRMDAAATGTFNGTLSFGNDDPDENPFNFSLTGTVMPPPFQIIDNGDPGFGTVGNWSPYANEGYQNDIHYSAAGSGADVASWTFSVTPGIYRVSATWSIHANRATNAPFTVEDGGSPFAAVQVNQQIAPNDFTAAGATWEDLGGNYAITSNSLVVRLADNANQYVIADAVRVERLGNLPSGPEIQVLDGSTDLTDGSAVVNYGTTPPGTPVSKTYTVKNVGNQNLTLASISAPSGFTVTAPFGSTTLAPGATTTFTVRLDAAAVGSYGGALSFGNNDGDENPFNYTVQGAVANPPQITIIDNGDDGFSTAGNWFPYGNEGFQNDIHYSAAGSGADVAGWTFTVTPGIYRVSATWSASANRATNSPFTVWDNGNAFSTVQLNQQLAPNDFTDAGAAWENIGGNYSITSTTLVVRLSNNANQYVIADGMRIERVGNLPSGPEIQVQSGSTDLADGSAVVNYGTTPPGTPVSRTFTVNNLGNQDLTLGAISVPAGFTVTASFGATTLTPGAATTFTVRLDAVAAGSFSGQLSFGTNDSDENPFNFTIQGNVAAPPDVTIIDNGDAGFATSGAWSPYPNEGFQNDIHYSAAGNGANLATWTFAVTPGIYRVSATWSTSGNRATNSPFTIVDGGAPLATIALNQQLAPNDFTGAGASWEDLGGPYSITGNSLVVQLTNNANQYVIADAVRIERLGSLPNGPEIQVLDGTTDLPDGSAVVSFGTTPPGTPVSKTFTVKNLGNQDLTLGSLSVPAGFTVTGNFGATTLAAGASTTFTVRLDAAAVGTYSGQLSFGNNDGDENPFNFTIQGTVAAAPAIQIIDNGDAGFSTVGNWSPYANQGYLNDIHYSAAGSGADVATWTFTVTPGVYRIAATWNALPNRATNSPFTVFDGSTPLATVQLNQQLTPNDFTDAGAAWEDIGGPYAITGNTLVVTLTNNANQYVIADGIRIEKIG